MTKVTLHEEIAKALFQRPPLNILKRNFLV